MDALNFCTDKHQTIKKSPKTKSPKTKEKLSTIVLEVRIGGQDDSSLNGQSDQHHLDGPVYQMDIRVRQLSTDGPQCGTNATSVVAK